MGHHAEGVDCFCQNVNTIKCEGVCENVIQPVEPQDIKKIGLRSSYCRVILMFFFSLGMT